MILKKVTKRTADIVFANEILKFYTDEELIGASQITENVEFYNLMFGSYIKIWGLHKVDKKTEIYRLVRYNSMLPLEIKMTIFNKEMEKLSS